MFRRYPMVLSNRLGNVFAVSQSDSVPSGSWLIGSSVSSRFQSSIKEGRFGEWEVGVSLLQARQRFNMEAAVNTLEAKVSAGSAETELAAVLFIEG